MTSTRQRDNIYHQLSKLSNSLCNETKINARRSISRQILEIISNVRMRQRLSRECGSNKDALFKIWRLIMKSSLHASEKCLDQITNGKSRMRLIKEDITLPFKILTYCDDQRTFHRMRKENGAFRPLDQPFTFESFYRYRGSQLHLTKMGSREILSLLNLCLNCLATDEVIQVLEHEMLDNLNLLCSRPDYVCHFHPYRQLIENVMEELQPRIMAQTNDARGNEVSNKSCRIFFSVIQQCAWSLGFSMHAFIHPCINMVAEWCRDHISTSYQTHLAMISNLYSAVTILIAHNPEQSVAVMSNSGHFLLNLATKCFPLTRGKEKQVLLDYFSSHLLLCEVAGKIQGLWQDDLGDIGMASLDFTQIDFLLQLLLSDRELEKLNEQRDELRCRKNDANVKNHFKSLSKLQMRYFELCARLLRYAQRYFLAQAELKSFDPDEKNDRSSAVLDEFEKCGKNYDGLGGPTSKNIKDSILCSSPWSRFVAKYITIQPNSSLKWTPSLTASTDQNAHECVEKRHRNKETVGYNLEDSDDRKLSLHESNDAEIQIQNNTENISFIEKITISETSIVQHLQLISACAESFPRGEIWSSTNQWRRRVHIFAEDSFALEDRNGDPFYCNVASLDDTAALISSICRLLEKYGGANGNQSIQTWSLICLLKLTEATCIICRYWPTKENNSSFLNLAKKWRNVWNTLFRSDLRYSSCTNNTESSSIGELVLMLLTEMIRNRCTDPIVIAIHFNRMMENERKNGSIGGGNSESRLLMDPSMYLSSFLFSKQAQVWSLPIFKNPAAIKTSSIFELASVLIQSAGLSEGTDCILSGGVFDEENNRTINECSGFMNPEALKQNKRRYRLSCFCIQFIRLSICHKKLELLRKTLPFVTACSVSLIGGHSTILTSTFSLESFRKYRCTTDTEAPCEMFSGTYENDAKSFQMDLAVLWNDVILPFDGQFRVDSNDKMWRLLQHRDCRLFLPMSREDRRWVQIFQKNIHSINCDNVSLPIINEFTQFAFKFLAKALPNVHLKGNDETSTKCDFYNILVMKFFFCLQFFNLEYHSSDNAIEIPNTLLKDMVADIPHFLNEEFLSSSDFSWFLVDLIGVFRAMKNICLFKGNDCLQKVFGKDLLSKIKATFEILLKDNVTSGVVKDKCFESSLESTKVFNSDEEAQSLSDYSDSAFLSDDNLIDTYEEKIASSKRKRAVSNSRSSKRTKRVEHSNKDFLNMEFESDRCPSKSLNAWLCAKLLVVIDSSLDQIINITNCLSWPQGSSQDDTDCSLPEPHNSIICLDILLSSCSKNQRTNDGESTLSIMTRIILTGRCEAAVSTPYILLGFLTCSLIMKNVDIQNELKHQECEDLLQVLYPEGNTDMSKSHQKLVCRVLKTRPNLRSMQIRSATYCFREAPSIFHDKFDSIFSHFFIIAAIVDTSNYHVRFCAQKALQAAIQHLSSQKVIVDEVLGLLPQIWSYSIKEEDEMKMNYKSWVKNKLSMNNEILNETSIEHQSWIDNRHSFEYDSIKCIGILGSYTSDPKISLDMIFKLIHIAHSNSKFLCLCFHWLEHISLRRSFPRLELMFDEEQEWFLQKWIQSEKKLINIPIIVSSPGIFRCIMRLNEARNLTRKTASTVREIEPMESGTLSDAKQIPNNIMSTSYLEDDGLCDFMMKVAKSAIPIFLMIPAKHLHVDLKTFNETIDLDKIRWQYLSEITHILTGNDTKSDVCRVLKNHIHDIFAYLIPFQYKITAESTVPVEQSISDSLRFLRSLFPDELIHREMRKKSNLSIQRIIKLSGREAELFGVSLGKSSCERAIRYICEMLVCNKKQSSKDYSFFRCAGSSTVEIILHAQKDFYESQSQVQKKNAWKAIELVCDIVVRDCRDKVSAKDDSQLCFCMKALLALSQMCDDISLRISILSTLKCMLECLPFLSCVNKKQGEISLVFNKLFITIIQIHDQALVTFVSNCVVKKKELTKRKRIMNGLIQLTAEESSSDGSSKMFGNQNVNFLKFFTKDSLTGDDIDFESLIFSHHHFVDENTKKLLITCFDILDLVLSKQFVIFKQFFNALDPFPTSQFSNQKTIIIHKLNRKFVLSDFFQKFEELYGSISGTDIENELISFSLFAKRLRFNNFVDEHNMVLNNFLHPGAFFQKDDQISSLTIQRSLLAAIVRLRKALQSQDCFFLPSKIRLPVFHVIEDLFHLSTQSDTRIITEISRCFGELSKVNLSHLSPLDMNGPGDCHKINDFFQNPSFWFKGRIFELVSYFIESEDIDTAILAKDTAKALTKSKNGADLMRTVKLGHSKELLQALCSHTSDFRISHLTLSDDYIEKLKSFALPTSEDLNPDNEWCWSKKIWTHTHNEEKSYECWIKNIVCSIIVCYFGHSDNNHFFSICAKLCQREHAFASFVFPAIIYHLIESDKTDISILDTLPLGCTRSSSNNEKKASDDAVIGSKLSRINQLVTKCFSEVLRMACSRDDNTNLSSLENTGNQYEFGCKDEMRKLGLIIPVINMFRSITSKRFMMSKLHKTNPRKLKTRKCSFQNTNERASRVVDADSNKIPAKLYSKILEESPFWRGVPYGVVLHMNGLDLTRACVKAKLYLSSLYYIEMYADNQFCGSGRVLERLSHIDTINHGSFQSFSMSGFGILSTVSTQKDATSSLLNDAKSFQSSLRQIYSKLMEDENVKGTDQFSNITHIKLSGLINGGNCQRNKILRKSHMFQSLIDIDTDLQKATLDSCEGKMGLPEDGRSMIITLNNLGLRHISERYIESWIRNQDEFPTSDKKWLDERRSEQAWRLSQWDDSIFHAGLHLTNLNHESDYTTPFSESGKGCTNNSSSIGLQEAIRSSFRCIIKEDIESFEKWLCIGRENILQEMNENVGIECLSNGIPDYVVKLRTLNEIEQLGMVHFQKKSVHHLLRKWELVPSVENNVILQIKNASFSTKEFFMSVREVALRTLCQKFGHGEDIGAGTALSSHLFSFCKFARQEGCHNVAESALIRLCQLHDRYNLCKDDLSKKAENSIRIRLEETKIMKCRGDDTEAIRNLKYLIASVRNSLQSNVEMCSYTGKLLLSECLLLCSQWLIKHKLDSGTTILKDYLKPSVDLLTDHIFNEEIKESLAFSKRSSVSNFALGDFTSSLFEMVWKRMTSQDWKRAAKAAADRIEELQRSKVMLGDLQKEMESMKKSLSKTRKKNSTEQHTKTLKKKVDEVYIHVVTLEKEVQRDNKERKLVEQSAARYLHLSLSAFGAALSSSDTKSQYIKHVYQMISLWFNAQITDNQRDANMLMLNLCESIPTFWFVRLTYQIFSRIDLPNEQDNDFQHTLHRLVLKICKDHPYHSILQLIALSNGKKVGSGVSGRHASMYLDNVSASKVDASCNLIKSLRKNGPEYVSGLVDSYDAIIDAYIQLAMAPTAKMIQNGLDIKNIEFSKVGSPFGVKQQLNQCITSKRNFPFPPCVLTKPPLLQPSGDYGNGLDDPLGSERIDSFNRSFSLTETGVHRPKIVMCNGTKGGSFKQVVKGEDDIRQDAVMEQVFNTLNSLLKSKSDDDSNLTLTKHLKVVTYNIIPLSPASGVLEWVDGTMPIGDYLTDKGTKVGAHSKYYPGEWGNHLCRLHHQNAPVDRKREAFDEICKNFSPVFRFFFHERFIHSLQAWHAARMNYVTSCAVSSIVGHVLGIGDRHSHNILIHQKSGKVVHIDFGIVFEQGKCLTVPETVPFRLTRDMVDGLGPLGTEGTFVAAAEATMDVLRENSGTILSVLSAVVSDPLYKWCISPVTARRRQCDDENQDPTQDESTHLMNDYDSNKQKSSENDAAILALAKVREKLQGYEEGLSGERQSVEGQVRFLINSATDKDNLCALFSGWAPWL